MAAVASHAIARFAITVHSDTFAAETRDGDSRIGGAGQHGEMGGEIVDAGDPIGAVLLAENYIAVDSRPGRGGRGDRLSREDRRQRAGPARQQLPPRLPPCRADLGMIGHGTLRSPARAQPTRSKEPMRLRQAHSHNVPDRTPEVCKLRILRLSKNSRRWLTCAPRSAAGGAPCCPASSARSASRVPSRFIRRPDISPPRSRCWSHPPPRSCRWTAGWRCRQRCRGRCRSWW